MDSIIDNKFFDLITKDENFEFAYDINERFENIRQKLWIDFFDDLRKKLKLEHNDFIIEKTDDWEFVLSYRKWNVFKFYYNFKDDHIKIGILSNYIKNKKLFSEIDMCFREIMPDFSVEINTEEFRYFIICDEDLSTLHGLKRILPENREKIISEYYLKFKRLLEDIQESIIKFEESAKLPQSKKVKIKQQ
jgi:hypothetical protein